MFECFVCIYVCASYVCGAHGSQEKGPGPRELELQVAIPLCWCWELNLGALEEQGVLTSEPSPKPQRYRPLKVCIGIITNLLALLDLMLSFQLRQKSNWCWVVVEQAFNLNIWEAETEGSPSSGQPGLKS